MTEWYQAKILRLCELNNVEEKKDVLTDIKIKFSGLNCQDAEQVARNLNYEPLFSQLTSSDREDIEQICEILTILINVLEPGEIFQRCEVKTLTLITNPNASVRLLLLHEFLRIASSEKIILLFSSTDLLNSIINRLSDNDLTIAECAMNIIRKVAKNPLGIGKLYQGEPLKTINMLLQQDIICFRVFEVVVDIAKYSTESLLLSAGILHCLINKLENEDILLQLNALELVTQLAISEEGLRFLEQEKVLDKLAQKIAQAKENPLSDLLIPGLMKFFGNVARHWTDELFSKYPVIISALFEVIDSGDQNILGVALDTLGFLSTSVEGKYALQSLGDAMPGALKKIAEIVQTMPTALRIRGLDNLALILKVETHEQDNRILSLTKQWFDSLCDDPLNMIVTMCRQPFADIREAGLEVLAVISSQEWGQEYISIHPGLVEFLLDRNIESFKECKDAKYKVVKHLSRAERDIFDADTMQKFKQFVKEGPYFVDVNTEVAIEGAL